MKKEFGNYYLGLDVGTNSIGWAVTDENYKILKFNSKSMWGSRLFDEGQTAASRRLVREARRRQARRVERIKLLQSLFAEEISKIDQAFFIRLRESKFYLEDKNGVNTKDTLFADDIYNDKDYHKDYQTIYHLRKAFIENKDITDPRLLYLACAHIIKHRGHFLLEGVDANIEDIALTFNAFKDVMKNEFDWDLEFVKDDDLEKILKEVKGIRNKKEHIYNLFKVENDCQKEVSNLLIGASAKLSKIFDIPSQELKEAKIESISFSEGIEEKIGELEKRDDINYEVIDVCKALYDWAVLSDILKGTKYISYAKVNDYEQHKNDLKDLKTFIRKYIPGKYNDIFRNRNVKNNYVSYVANIHSGNKKQTIESKVTQREFCKYLNSLIKNIDFSSASNIDLYIKEKIENGTICPKQKVKENCVVPYQLNEKELKIILENASKHFDFLNQKDSSGLTISEKILKIFSFRIPYYVGPLNTYHANDKGFAWAARKSNEKVTPWNFENVIDVEHSAEVFIKKLTNKCQYLPMEDVIPVNSIVFSKYKVLNELNNLSIDGNKLSVEIKQKIFNDLYLNNVKVTKKTIVNYLRSEGYCDININQLTGIAHDIMANMKSYVDLNKILNEKYSDDLAERIIELITIFHDDKKLLKTRLECLNTALNRDEINSISRLNYKEWAPFSKMLLCDICDENPKTGEINFRNIIDGLYNSQENFMELLSNNHFFMANIDKENNQYNTSDAFTYDNLVANTYCSPAVKRALWQSLLITKEIRKICGHDPEKIFIEMARGPEEKKEEKSSRKESLLILYKVLQEEEKELYEQLNDTDQLEFRKDALYLYYTQRGKCMYSGEPINVEDIYNQNLYDIDHIYPQSKCKDDSLDNRVLVKKQLDNDKSDIYPIPYEWRNKMKSYWKDLKEKGFISTKKYERLIRNSELTEEELAGFIQRQIVETRQSTRELATLLKGMFNSEIVYVKAKTVADFKNDNGLVKVREINDLHHAKDAYINIVVGNVWNTKFTSNPLNYVKNSGYREYNLRKMYDYDVIRNDKVAWISGDEGSIKTIVKQYYHDDVLVTKKVYENHGQLFDLQPLKKGRGQFELKKSDKRLTIEKYGGYNSVSIAYFMAIESEGLITIEAIPVYIVIQKNEEIKNYLDSIYGVDNYKIKAKLPLRSLLEINGYKCYITGKSDVRFIVNNAVQLNLSKELQSYFKEIVNYIGYCKNKNLDISPEKYCKYHNVKLTKEENNILFNKLVEKLDGLYSEVYSGILEKNSLNKFYMLTNEEQVFLLYDVIKIFNTSPNKVDLSKIGGQKGAGFVRYNKYIKKVNSLILINQSITGLFETKVRIK